MSILFLTNLNIKLNLNIVIISETIPSNSCTKKLNLL
jgi:hypothetical protein